MKLKQLISSYKKNEDAKGLTETFLSLTILQFASYVFPLFTIPYLAHVIGLDKMGDIAFAAAVVVYFQTVVDWGFNYSAARDVARNKNNPQEVSIIYSNVMTAKLSLTIICAIIFAILVFTVPAFSEKKMLMFATYLYIPCGLLIQEWLFQGLERMRYFTILNLILKFLFTAAIFVFIREKSDYILQPLLNACGNFAVGIASIVIIRKKLNVKYIRPNIKSILQSIKGSTDIFINQLMPNLYNSFSVMLLGFFGGSVANGKLDGGTKFVNLCNQMMSVVTRTFFPFLSRNISKHAVYAKWNIIISSVISLLLFAFAPLIVDIFLTDEFVDSILVLRIMAISVLFLTLSSIYGTNYLIVQNKERILRKITIISSLIGFSMSVPMVYYWGYIGAAITITLTRGILGVTSMIVVLKIKKQKQLA
jgi:PST family polysaccharide transporter